MNLGDVAIALAESIEPHRDELGVVCTHGQLERVCPLCELTVERDALAALVKEMHDWTVGEGDHAFAWDSWLVRARAAIGEGK